MESYFVNVDGKKMHFLKKGEGPPIFLFHASPLSSHSLLPLIDRLSHEFTVIAPDTPGYGKSQPPESPPKDISDYAKKLHHLQVLLGFKKIAIYGTATGAQIGIRYSLIYPDEVAYLFLDNTAHFTDDEKDKIMESYFPDYTPDVNGKFLLSIWDTVGNLFKFFPWCFKTEEYKLTTPVPPPEILHNVFLEYLKSGSKYDWAYRAAFHHEDRRHIYKIRIPVLIYRWELSILKKYTDRIFEKELPSNISFEHISKEENRFDYMSKIITRNYKGVDYKFESDKLTKGEDGLDQISLPLSIPSFPNPEESGQYLLNAWSILDNYLGSTETLDRKKTLFMKWAESLNNQLT